MKYFVDSNGIICWINELGQSNHPAIAMHGQSVHIKNGKLQFLNTDNTVDDEYVIWDSLIALAIAIEEAELQPTGNAMHIDAAALIAHKSIETFRTDWHKGHISHKENYPLVIEEGNIGIYFEQMAMELTSNQEE